MPAAGGAHRLGARHEEGAIRLGGHSVGIGRSEEARPARARFELGVGAEELGAAAGASIGSRPMLIPQVAGEGTLGSLLAKDPVLLRAEGGPPLGLRLDDLWCGLGICHG